MSQVIENYFYDSIGNYGLFSKEGLGQAIEFLPIIIAIQATLTAVLFPLALTVVSILMANSSAKDDILKVYRSYSGIEFFGLVSLALVLLMAALRLALPLFIYPVMLAVSLSLSIGFLFTLLGTITFVQKTFQFLFHRKRIEAIHAQLLSESVVRAMFELKLKQKSIALPSNEELDSDNLNLPDAVGALFSSLRDLTKQNDLNAFEYYAERLFTDLEDVFRAAEDEKEQISIWSEWLSRFKMVTLFGVFSEEVEQLYKLAINKLPEEIGFLRQWNYFYFRTGRAVSQIPMSRLRLHVEAHFRLWVLLIAKLRSFHLSDTSNSESQREAVNGLITSWERWSLSIKCIEDDQSRYAEMSQHYIDLSCAMVLKGVECYNTFATKQSIDMLMHLWDKIDNRKGLVGTYYKGPIPELYNVEVLRDRNDDGKPSLLNRLLEKELDSATWLQALHNYWVHRRIIVASVLLKRLNELAEQENAKDELALLSNSFRQLSQHDNNLRFGEMPFNNLRSILYTYIGFYGGWQEANDYRWHINRQLSEFARIFEEKGISGRVKVRNIIVDDEYLPLFFQVIGIVNARSKINLPPVWDRFLETTQSNKTIGSEEFGPLRVHLQKLIDDTRIEQAKELVSNIFGIKESEISKNVENFKNSVEKFKTALNKKVEEVVQANKEHISKAEIDKDIRSNLENSSVPDFVPAGEDDRSKVFPFLDFPIPVYLSAYDKSQIRTRDNTRGPFDLIKITIEKFQKERIVASTDYVPAINEFELQKHQVALRMLAALCEELFNPDGTKEQCDDEVKLLKKVISDAKEMSKAKTSSEDKAVEYSDWLLVVDNSFLANRLRDVGLNMMEEHKTLPFDFHAKSNQSATYLCHINELGYKKQEKSIEVHRLPYRYTENSIALFPRSALKSIDIMQHENGKLIEAEFAPDEDKDPLYGTLSLTFYMRVSLEKDKVKVYKFDKKND